MNRHLLPPELVGGFGWDGSGAANVHDGAVGHQVVVSFLSVLKMQHHLDVRILLG